MYGFKKYLVILGISFLGLWFLSLILYRDVIGAYITQSINGLYNAGISFLVTAIVIFIIIKCFLGIFRG